MSLHVSRSSQSVKGSRLEKSSRYNRKKVSIASHTLWVRHIGCSSKAASGNVGESHKKVCSRRYPCGYLPALIYF